MNIKNTWLHFKKICKHKYYVGKYCWKIGLYWQGITHDLSKFSPIEFFESAKYYQGDRSSIDICKERNGISHGWQHHKGRNPHHYEYYVDDLDNGGKALIMPKKYAFEMVCDYIGAGKAYMGKDFTYNKEYQWWVLKKSKPLKMHPVIIHFIGDILYDLTRNSENDVLTRDKLNKYYDKALFQWERHMQ